SNEVFACASPVAPTLSATPGNNQVGLKWSASPGATSYTVKRGPTAANLSIVKSGIAGTSYSDTSAANGSTYFYSVDAVNASALCNTTSADSNVVPATPSAPAVPAAPTNLKATTGSGKGKITLTWTGSAGATSYNVYRSTSSNSTGSKIASGV